MRSVICFLDKGMKRILRYVLKWSSKLITVLK